MPHFHESINPFKVHKSTETVSELIQKKDELIHENHKLAIHKLEYDKVIKDQNISLNQMNTKGVNNKMKLILPFLFVLLYLLGYWFSQLYKKQRQRIQAS